MKKKKKKKKKRNYYGQSLEVAFPRRMYPYFSFQTISFFQHAPVLYRCCLELFESDKTSSEFQVYCNMEKGYLIKEREYALNSEF